MEPKFDIVETVLNSPFARSVVQNEWRNHNRKCFILFGESEIKESDFAGNIGLQDITDPNSVFYKTLENCHIWIIHRYKAEFRALIKRNHNRCLIIIQTWGPDYLGCYSTSFNIYEQETRRLLQENRIGSEKNDLFSLRIWSNFRRFSAQKLNRHRNRRAFSKVGGVMFCLPNESKFIRFKIFFDLTPLRLNRYNDTSHLSPLLNEPNVRWVQLGHSADPANNHVDALLSLKKKNIRIERILIPLSYGGTESYVRAVKCRAQELFPGRCEFLEEMLPFDEYQNLISDYGIFVSNVIRQQAIGNYFLAIARGAKIILNENSVGFDFLKDLGIPVDGINQGVTSEINEPFSTNETLANIQKIQNFLEQNTLESVRKEIIEMCTMNFMSTASTTMPGTVD